MVFELNVLQSRQKYEKVLLHKLAPFVAGGLGLSTAKVSCIINAFFFALLFHKCDFLLFFPTTLGIRRTAIKTSQFVKLQLQ